MPHADYYSYCDQDDVWLENKVCNAVKVLSNEDDSIPLIYYTALKVVDVNLKEIVKQSHSFFPKDDKMMFQNSILQSMINGCTCVFNNKLREEFCKIPIDRVRCCDMVLNNIACGIGKSIFSKDAQILYRQHPGQCYGYVSGTFKMLLRTLKSFFKNEIKSTRFYDTIVLKQYIYDLLDQEKKEFIDLIYY